MENFDQLNNLQDSKLESSEEPKKTLGKEEVYKIISSALPLSDTEGKMAPFAEYAKNTHESWKYVPPEEVEEFLRAKPFFDTSIITSQSRREVAEIRTSMYEEGIKVPLDLIVCAAGFKSWLGRAKGHNKRWSIRSGRDYLDGEMSSLNVIKIYAGTPTDLPPVDIMSMYIQPNGKVFFDNVGGDSHRIAAAVLRGDKNIDARMLFVYELNRDYI